MSEKERLFVDMDGCLCDFEASLKIYCPEALLATGETREDLIDQAQATKGFYRYMPPMEGAIDAYKRLSEKYDTFILSAPSWDDASSWSEKKEWVEDYLPIVAYRKLILTHDKGMYTGRALIDDRKKYNVDLFNGEHIHFGTNKFPDWACVLKYLL